MKKNTIIGIYIITALCLVALIMCVFKDFELGCKYDRLLKPTKDSVSSVRSYPSIGNPKYKKDSIKLSKEQFERIGDYVQYVGDKVDKAVEHERDEVNNDISRLNLWMTIWSVLLMAFGVFVPVFLERIASNKLTDEFNKKFELTDTNLAKIITAAQSASETIITIKENVKKLDEELPSLKGKYSELKTEVDTAKKHTESANKMIFFINAVYSLSSLQVNNIQFALDKNFYVKIKLEKIINAFNELIANHNEIDFVKLKPSLSEFALTLQIFRKYFEHRDHVSAINIFYDFLSEKLTKNMNKQDLQEIINAIEILKNAL